MSATLHDCYIAFGSNLGAREKNITAALGALQTTKEIDVVKVSSLYETKPEGGPPNQPNYINAVAHIRSTLSPERLLAVCQRIETFLGRKRAERWGPRTIDLDLLLYDDEIRADPDLTLPHPMMHERAFVLKPLVEVAPDLVHPVLQQSAKSILESADFGA